MSLVEYHDPDGLFSLLSPHLLARLPLKNLHWKSATRPLRTIPALQVDFVPAASASSEASSKRSQDTAVGSDGRPSITQAERARRHQIPGLQQTPFLKLYILRCDDKDAYKSSSRKLLREWLKDNVPQSPSSDRVKSAEDHDAFEWLILHVVLPDTYASTQPRFSKAQSVNDTESLGDRSTSGSKWPGRGSRTILEKLRKDFNPSSKSSLDRVAQVRLQCDVLPERWVQTLSASGLTPFPETPQDRENAWSDVIGKLKTLILTSFNLRVTQYEDDIRERDSQRSLPGWNFCTFFVLKEGLARSFESVGLTEDALVMYDELSVGLDTTVRDQSQNETSALSPFTPELRDRLRDASRKHDEVNDEDQPEKGLYTRPLSVDNKDYRTLIVSSNISLFDFRCYIFCRQKALLLRLAGLNRESQNSSKSGPTILETSPAPSGTGHETATNGEIAVQLSELCHRTAEFTVSTARTMRDDLWVSFDGELESGEDSELIIDTIVSSWKFSVLQQIIDESFSPMIPTPSSLRRATDRKSQAHPGAFPQRQSSLAVRSQQQLPALKKDTDELYFHDIDISDITTTKNVDIANWVAHRADLYLLQKKILERIGLQFGLRCGKDTDKSLASGEENAHKILPSVAVGNLRLRSALSSSKDFENLYERVTDRAAWLYSIAARKGSAEKLICDLAQIKHYNGDYSGAAKYYAQALPNYELQKWHTLENSLLEKYAKCLEILHRRDEYVKVVLAILAKIADTRKAVSRSKLSQGNGSSVKRPLSDDIRLDEELHNDNNYFSALVECSQSLAYDYSAPLQQYFEIIELDRNIQLLDHEDGFQFSLKVRQLLCDRIVLDAVKVRLVDASGNHGKEVWIHSRSKVVIGSDALRINLHSNTTAMGNFIVDKVMFQAGKILFVNETVVHNYSEPTLMRRRISTAVNAVHEVKGPLVSCYPRPGSFQAVVLESLTIHVGKPRALDLHVESGLNDVIEGKIIIRSATAGLRLHTAEASVRDGNISIIAKSNPGEIDFGKLQAGGKGTITLPYTTEQSSPTISLRLEVQYSTSSGNYIFASNPAIKPILLLDVNVQDIFRETAVYSKFQLRSLGGAGLRLLDAKLEGSKSFDACALASHMNPAIIFPDQPLVLTYRVFRQSNESSVIEGGDTGNSLLLTIHYRHVEDDVLSQCTTALERDLEHSPFGGVRLLLLNAFKDILRRSLTFDDYERAASFGEIHLPLLNQAVWLTMIKHLPKVMHEGLLGWLQDWHDRNTTLSLLTPVDPTYNDRYQARELIIKVDVPGLDFLHTASMRLLDVNTTSTLNAPVSAAGQPVPAELRIRHTRRWAQNTAHKSQTTETKDFVYQIQCDPAQWLVGGQRRVEFSAKEDEELVFMLILIPLTTGRLLLPTVDIQPVTHHDELAPTNEDDGDHEIQGTPTCQTDCTSQSRTVLVIEDMRSTTISIGQSDVLARQGALIESEPRTPLSMR